MRAVGYAACKAKNDRIISSHLLSFIMHNHINQLQMQGSARARYSPLGC
jgi:hypothetical protein